MSLRPLRYHEKKLLKKVDFLEWKSDQNLREIRILRRYHIQRREDYHKYNRLVGLIHKLVVRLRLLSPSDPDRIQTSAQVLDRLYQMGLITSDKTLSDCVKITASAFCRRRLSVLLCRLHFTESISEAVKVIEAGHIRVGPDTVTDPAFLVTRSMEDFVTWTDTSKIKHKIQHYHRQADDYTLQGN